MKNLVSYIVFAVALGVVSLIFYIDTLDMPKAAAELPRLLIGLVMLLSLMMVGERIWLLRRTRSEINNHDTDTDDIEESTTAIVPAERGSLVRIGVFVTALCTYVMTIETLGYFIATPLFLVGILSFLRSTKLHTAMIIAVGFTGFVYLLFVVFLNLPVPMGLLDHG